MSDTRDNQPHGSGSSQVSPRGVTPDNAADDIAFGAAMLSASADCVKFLDLDGRVRSISQAGRALMELDGDDTITGNFWIDLFPRHARDLVANALIAAREDGSARFSAQCPTAKGTPKWWDVVLTLIRGEPTMFLAVSRDITSLKAIETSLRNSQQRFRALADNMSQLAWMADKTGSIFWYNQRWFEYTGTTLPEMVGWGWRKVHHPEHVDRVVAKIQAHFTSGDPWEDLFPLRGADGQFRWFLSRASALRDDAGNITLWCGTNTDISDQRNASQRLRQLARILEMSHEAIIIWDLHSGILQWNRGCEQLYGFDKQQAIGRDTYDLLQTRLPVPREEVMRALLEDGAWSGEICHIARDGHEVWVDSRQEIIRVGGRDIVLETNRDNTDRRAADDVRNLLVAELNHRVKNTLAVAQSIVKQSARNATDVQDFVASFRGRLQSISSAHNVLTDAHWIGASVRELIASQLEVTTGDGARVILDGPEAFLPPQTALQMTMIIHELAMNAVKYGALSTRRGRVDVSWTVTRDQAQEKQRPLLRVVWSEADGPPVTPPRALGFGLTLIDRSGRLPHLKTEVSFDPAGVVCTILAALPEAGQANPPLFNPGSRIAAQASADAPEPSAPYRPAPRVRLLVVMGDPVDALTIDERLADAGFTIVGTAVTAGEASKAVASAVCEAAVVDLDMPGLTATNVLPTLRGRGARIVALTREPRRHRNELDAGDVVLDKPADITSIVTAVGPPRSR